MPDDLKQSKGGFVAMLARLGAIGVAVLIAAGAFAGMGLFMFNMGRDMSDMTVAVIQMGRDVSSMAGNMDRMSADMQVMAKSMVEGQAGMSQDFARVLPGWSG
jgi:hypothetical protein